MELFMPHDRANPNHKKRQRFEYRYHKKKDLGKGQKPPGNALLESETCGILTSNLPKTPLGTPVEPDV